MKGSLALLGRLRCQMWALVAAPPCLGVPGGSALTAGETNFCGDPSLDVYFNKHCSNAVAKVAEHCCDEFPPSDKCDEWRMACINTHVKDGRCSDPTDCEPGCRLFNSMTATCCPHVKQKMRNSTSLELQSLVLLDVPDDVKQPALTLERKEENPPAQHPTVPYGTAEDHWCNSASNDALFSNVCGWDSKIGYEVIGECCGVEHVKIPQTERLQMRKNKERRGWKLSPLSPTCELHRKSCVAAAVASGKCADEATCSFGNQTFEQATISCCPKSPSPPPSPPPPGDHGKLCSRYAPKQVGYDLMP